MPETRNVIAKSLQGGQERRWHYHRHAAVTFVTQGSMTETFADGSIYTPRGSLQFKPARLGHSMRIGPMGSDLFVSNLVGTLNVRQPTMAGRFDGPLAVAFGVALMAEPAADCRSTVDRVLAAWPTERASQVADWLCDARVVLDNSPFETRPLARLARLVGRHPVYLARTFKRAYGVSPAAYQRRVRLSSAVRRILETEQLISAVAADCGYADQSHMVHEFARVVGLPPSRLRQEAARLGVR